MGEDVECSRCGEYPGFPVDDLRERNDALALQAAEWEGKYAAVSEMNAALKARLEQRVAELQITLCKIEELRGELAARDAEIAAWLNNYDPQLADAIEAGSYRGDGG